MNLKSLPSFRHSRLDLSHVSIRLLDVLPRQHQQQGLIQCRIRHVRIPVIKAGLVYTALSYEWGSSCGPLRSIEVEGSRFDIQENLYKFLENHGELGISNLWVDAICINQNDILEKNHQVKHMKDIYENASTVIIWLGPEEDDSEPLFDFLASNQMPGLDPTTFENWAEENFPALMSMQRKIFSANNNIIQAAYRLCQRSYWTRTWIVQEVLLGHLIELTCGTKRASWVSWVAFIQALARVPEDTMDSLYWPYRPLILGVRYSPAFTLYKQWQTNIDNTIIPKQLISLVLAFAQTECARTHDKVYAFLGLASDAQEFDVDYGMPMEDLLVSLLTSVAASTSDDDISTLCKLFNVSPPRLTLSIDLYLFVAQNETVHEYAFPSRRGREPRKDAKDLFRNDGELEKEMHSFEISETMESILAKRSNKFTAKGFIQQYGSLSQYRPPHDPHRAKALILEKGGLEISLSIPPPVDTAQWTKSRKNSPLICLCVRCMKLTLLFANAVRSTQMDQLRFYTIPIADDVKYQTYFIFLGKEYVATGTQMLISWHPADNYWSDMTLFYDPVTVKIGSVASIRMSTRQILNLVAHQQRSRTTGEDSSMCNRLIGGLKRPFCDLEKHWDPTWMDRQLQKRRITEFMPQLVPEGVQGAASRSIHGYDLLFSRILV